MPAQHEANGGVVRALEIVDLTIAQAHEAERKDLIQQLSDARRLLVDPPVTLHAVGGSSRIPAGAEGKSLSIVSSHVLFALDELTEVLRLRRSRLVRPGRSIQVRNSVRGTEKLLDEVRTRSARWQKLLRDGFATINSDVEFNLQQRIHTVLTEASHRLEHIDPARSWDEFANFLHHRLTSEAQTIHDFAVTSSRAVSSEAAKHLVPNDIHIIDPPSTIIPADLPAELTADKAPGSSRLGISAGMSIIFPAYGIFMMFYVLTNVVHLLPFPLVIGLVPAVLVGGLVIIEECRRRIEERRARARTIVRDYVVDFRIRITKDSRDLVRNLEHELRDAYGARSDQTHRSLARTLDLTRHALTELEQAPALLEQIDTELAVLADLRSRATGILPDETAGRVVAIR
jgi:hypothetical protein